MLRTKNSSLHGSVTEVCSLSLCTPWRMTSHENWLDTVSPFRCDKFHNLCIFSQPFSSITTKKYVMGYNVALYESGLAILKIFVLLRNLIDLRIKKIREIVKDLWYKLFLHEHNKNENVAHNYYPLTCKRWDRFKL